MSKVLFILVSWMALAGGAQATVFSAFDAGVSTPAAATNSNAANAAFLVDIGAPLSTINFDALVPIVHFPFVTGGVTFTGTNQDAVDSGVYGSSHAGTPEQLGFAVSGTNFLQTWPSALGPLTSTVVITYPVNIFGWGAFFTGIQPNLGPTTIEWTDGAGPHSVPIPGDTSGANGGFGLGGEAFVGITGFAGAGTNTITIRTVSSSGVRDIYGIDDAIGAVPEPATGAMVGVLLVGASLLLRRIRRGA